MTQTAEKRVSPSLPLDANQIVTDPNIVMQPERLQSLAPGRLSATRAVLERMVRERWRFERVFFDIDANSAGEALYRVHVGERVFDFLVFAYEPTPEGRTGRIIQVEWDMMAAVIEGPTTAQDRATTREQLHSLYYGRATPGTLTWARSNRSFRAFNHVVEALADGRQPDLRFLWEIGYLMRNTGLDGNGTFDTRSFLALEEDHPLRDPLHAQLFSAFLLREYASDLVNAVAQHRSANAVELAPELRRMVGIGNGSAMGLLFYVNTHPHLINAWLEQRQQLIADAARIQLALGDEHAELMVDLARRAATYYKADPYVYHWFEDPHRVGADLEFAVARLEALLTGGPTSGEAWLTAVIEEIGAEAWEVIAVNLLELLDSDTIDEALAKGIVTETMLPEPAMTVGELRELLDREYAWAQAIDMDAPGARHFIWYKSRDAEEPRRGPATEVVGGRNWALDLPGDIQTLIAELDKHPDDRPIGEILAVNGDLRAIVERAQSLAGKPYHSPHMNMLDQGFVPARMVRFMNAAIHGLQRTVDGEDGRNVLGLIYLGAPTADEINAGTAVIDPYPLPAAITDQETGR